MSDYMKPSRISVPIKRARRAAVPPVRKHKPKEERRSVIKADREYYGVYEDPSYDEDGVISKEE